MQTFYKSLHMSFYLMFIEPSPQLMTLESIIQNSGHTISLGKVIAELSL